MSSRRGNKEGSIRHRADGRWEARVTIGGRQRSIYAKTRAEVARKMRQAIQQVESGIPLADERTTVAQFLNTWLETVVESSVRPSTFRSYEMHVRIHLSPALGKKRLAKLAPHHVQEMMNAKLAEGLSPQTVRHIRATLRRALGHALKWGLVSRNVATLVDPPKVPRRKVEPLTEEGAAAILDAVSGHRLEALYTVAMAIGLRQGEALGLRWQDVDLDGGKLRVVHALQRIDGELQLVEPKSAQARRTIILPEIAIAALKRHRALQNRERLAAGGDWVDGDFVFTTTVGTPLDGPNVTRTFQRLLKNAGLPPHRFHDLRHDCATLLLAQGVPLRVVKEILGHSQISLTADTYAHVVPALQQDAAARMDEALGERSARRRDS
ncbi:MAG: site-specific integrase [Caldilineae bacterium]|nr:site-specific integrase [Caldilineae bacterium]